MNNGIAILASNARALAPEKGLSASSPGLLPPLLSYWKSLFCQEKERKTPENERWT